MNAVIEESVNQLPVCYSDIADGRWSSRSSEPHIFCHVCY